MHRPVGIDADQVRNRQADGLRRLSPIGERTHALVDEATIGLTVAFLVAPVVELVDAMKSEVPGYGTEMAANDSRQVSAA